MSPSIKLPRVIEQPERIRDVVMLLKRDGQKVGLVPTMGALHAGHMALVDAAKSTCDVVAVTIFVNPTQFDDISDLERYPRTLNADLELLATREVDLVFAPSANAMYSTLFETYVEPGALAKPFEGEHRPGHFRGVATIVLKLFNMLPADTAFFGQKDYQQTLIIRQMAADFDLPISISIEPIVREPDGLAMSSRNARLSDKERAQSLVLSQSLKRADEMVRSGETCVTTLLEAMHACIAREPEVTLEYLSIVREGTVEPIQRIDGPAVAILAAKVGETRLIDNWVLG